MALAPELTEELRYLEINVGRRIRSLRLGQSRSPLKGFGYEFESHRKYEVGEDFRRIDWNVSARMQEIYLKRHFEEREVSVFLNTCHLPGLERRFLTALPVGCFVVQQVRQIHHTRESCGRRLSLIGMTLRN